MGLGMEHVQLNLLDPGAVPVGHGLPLDEELPGRILGDSVAPAFLFLFSALKEEQSLTTDKPFRL